MLARISTGMNQPRNNSGKILESDFRRAMTVWERLPEGAEKTTELNEF